MKKIIREFPQVKYLEMKLARMIKGGRTYRWFEIKLAKELGFPIKCLENDITPMPLK